MAEKLSQIFGLRKTTYNQPLMSNEGTFEQETLFIQVEDCKSRATFGRSYAQVLGTLIVFAQMDKMPFGYFNKRIQLASAELTRQFFFFDIDQNPPNSPARVQNISERRVRFVYLYSAEYDPNHGELTDLEIEL